MATLSERLDHMVELYVAPWKDAGHSDPYLTLGNPATNNELDDFEEAIGRLLPAEARDVYRWHNGVGVWLVPDVGFPQLRIARAVFEVTKNIEQLPTLSNAADQIEPLELLAVFNIDKPSLCVRTTVGQRVPVSPVYYLDLENFDFIEVSKSISALIEHFIDELQAGHVELTEHGIHWKTARGAFSFFHGSMVPFGAK